MGCDIHAYLECKINGIWTLIDQPKIGRDYSLFSKMAGIRGNEKPIAQPRGFPDDVSIGTKFCSYDLDHTPSWLSKNEIEGLIEWYIENNPDCEDNPFTWMDLDPRPKCEIRLVFWFDS